MIRASTVAVLRAHMHSLEVMAAQCKEMSQRATNMDEYRYLRDLSSKLELLALEHRRSLNELTGEAAA